MMRKGFMVFMAALVLFGFGNVFLGGRTEASTQASFYVDPVGGNDANNGTAPGSAFATLERARDAVRLINGNMSGDIYVYLMDGTHQLQSTFMLNEADSGSNGFSVIYTAYAGAEPVVSGGVDISSGWVLHDSARNIYKRTGVGWNFRQLYVNEQRGITARHPNMIDEVTGAPYLAATNNAYPYTVQASDIGAWANDGTAEMVVINHWSQYRGRIAGYSGTTVNFKFPEQGFAWNHHNQGTAYYYFENALALLDSPGEWFLDRANATLYYKPRAGETMNGVSIIAPKVETLVSITGSDSSHKASDIVFSGIAFMYSNWDSPSQFGYVDIQAGYRYQNVSGGNNTETGGTARFATVAGAIELKYTSRIVIKDNRFLFHGGWSIMGEEGTDHTSIDRNWFQYNAGGAIALGITGDQFAGMHHQEGQSVDDTITNNTIVSNSLDYRDMVGIGSMLPANMVIASNELHDLPYTAISIGWGWNDAPNGMADNEVAYNHISRVARLLDDAGGIYSLGRMDGTNTFHHNFIHHLQPSPYSGGYALAGIYFDNGSVGKTASYNVLYETDHAWYAENLPNYNNGFQANYYSGAPGSWASGNVFASNTAVSGNGWPQAAIDIMHSAGPSPASAPALTNIAVSGTASASSVYGPGLEASQAIDGTPTTLWSPSGTDPAAWLQVDLGAAYTIAQVEVIDRQDAVNYGQTRQNFEVRASNDPSFATYTVLGGLGASPYPFHGSWKATTMDRHAYRYIRVAKTVNEYFTIGELRILSDASLPALTNRTTGSTVTASSAYDAGHVASRAIDGSASTLWSPSGADARPWLAVDLGAAYKLQQIVLTDRQDAINYGQTRQNFEIHLSNDPVFATYTIAGGLGATPYPFRGTWTLLIEGEQMYRYVRLAKSADEYFTLAELQILSE